MKSRHLAAFPLALVALLSCSESRPDPRRVFELAAQQIEATRTFQYSYSYTAADSGGTEVDQLSGEVTIERLDLSGSRLRARVTGRTTAGGAIEVDVAHDGETVRAVDSEEATVWFSAVPAAGPTLFASAQPALMYAFFDPRSLAGEATSTEVVRLPHDSVDGVECDAIRVGYDDDEEDSLWCFGPNGLPLRMEWIGPDGSTRLELQRLVTDPELGPTPFDLPVPAGFTARELSYGPPLGEAAPDWTLPLLGGGEVSLGQLAGRVVVLDFWATWCPPCIESLGSLAELQEEMADLPISFFAVNTLESGDPVAFAEQQALEVPVLLDGDELHATYARGNLPAFVVIDREGRNAGFGLGYFGEASELHARSLIERALSSDSPGP